MKVKRYDVDNGEHYPLGHGDYALADEAQALLDAVEAELAAEKKRADDLKRELVELEIEFDPATTVMCRCSDCDRIFRAKKSVRSR